MTTATSPHEAAAVRYASLREKRVAAARVGINSFCELVLRDEEHGDPVRQAPMHREWHALLDAEPRLVIMAHVEAAKTQQLSIARTLFELGRNPRLRIGVISNTHGQAVKIVRAVAQYIEKSEELHAIYPDLQPDQRGPWSETQLVVKRPVVSKDPSVQAFGVRGAIVGSRLDRIILDDVQDLELARTPEQRRGLMEWLDSQVLTRLTAQGRVVAIGTALHEEDALHTFEARGWPCYRYPVEDEDGEPRWPERWPTERIEAKRIELGVFEAGRALDLEVRNDETAYFKSDWIERAVARGENATRLSYTDLGEPGLLNVPTGWQVVVGVDPAVSKSANADLSALVAVLVHPDGTREVLEVLAGRWSGPEIIERIVGMHRRFAASRVVVETVAAQAYLHHWLKDLGTIPVVPFTTGKGRFALPFRIEEVGSEFAKGMWSVPSIGGQIRDKQTALLMRDLAGYQPSAHVPDRVSALAMAQYGISRGSMKVESAYLPWLGRR